MTRSLRLYLCSVFCTILLCLGAHHVSSQNSFPASKLDSTTYVVISAAERTINREKDRKTGKALLLIRERRNLITYRYNPGNKNFECSNHIRRLFNSREDKTGILDSATVSEPIGFSNIMSSGDYQSLINLFKFDKDILTMSDFPIDDKWILKNINKSNILKIAEARGAKWQFESKYTSKETKERIFSGYANEDSLNHFLRQYPKTIGQDINQKHSFRFYIDFITGSDTLSYWRFNFNFNNPWMKGKTSNIPATINPYINQNLINLLPKNFLGANRLDPEGLKWSYITWLLTRNKYIGQ